MSLQTLVVIPFLVCWQAGGNSARKSYVVNNERQQNNEGCVFLNTEQQQNNADILLGIAISWTE